VYWLIVATTMVWFITTRRRPKARNGITKGHGEGAGRAKARNAALTRNRWRSRERAREALQDPKRRPNTAAHHRVTAPFANESPSWDPGVAKSRRAVMAHGRMTGLMNLGMQKGSIATCSEKGGPVRGSSCDSCRPSGTGNNCSKSLRVRTRRLTV
jgi:hypothetical protein